ncbi:hypothetical protein DRP04_10405 [Archaeoglobales archaeon]|nr:MAG: hypothetical protein DRP04_10405 [Archaeoglobales archaeon]
MYIPKSPFVLGIELTTKCNLNCPHCSVDANPKGRSLPQDMVVSIIDEAERIGVKELVLGGGEPLLYENFFEICEYALSKGLNLSFVTNGTLVPEKIDFFIKFRKYNKSLQVGISLDGHTPELHGYFRPKETFESVIEAINLLHKADIKVHVLCVLNKANIKKIPEFLNFLSMLNISDVRFLPFMPVGRGKKYKEELLPPDKYYNILREKHEWSRIFKINIGFHMPWEFLFLSPEKRRPSPCEAGYLRLWINSSGDMFPCAYMSDLPIGNVYRDSISDVWLNSPMLKKLRDPTLLKGACATCVYRDGCRGGCRGLAYFLEGDYLCADPYCPIVNREKIR